MIMSTWLPPHADNGSRLRVVEEQIAISKNIGLRVKAENLRL